MTTPSVPNSIRKSTAPAESLVEEVITDIEHVFSPKPGGMIDTWHQEKARRDAAQKQAENAAEKVTEASAYTVKVAQLQPETISTNVIVTGNLGQNMILPYARNRYRATIIANAACVIAKDQSQALSGIGFPLPANVPFVVNARAQLWVSATTGAVTVSVIAEMYAENG